MYKVKVISLKRRQDRREKISHMFQHVPFEFVDAIDGKEYKLTAYDKKMIEGNEYEKHGIHIPSLVCANYMHLNLLDECANQPKEEAVPYFIFEDDVYLNEDVTFTFLLTVDYYLKEVMDSWQNSIIDYDRGTLNYRDDYVSDVVIQQLGQNNIPNYTCTLHNAFPVSVSSVELSNANENTISRVTVTMAYDDWGDKVSLAGTVVGIVVVVFGSAFSVFLFSFCVSSIFVFAFLLFLL